MTRTVTPAQRLLLREVEAWMANGQPHHAAVRPHPLEDGQTIVVDIVGAPQEDRDREVDGLAAWMHLGGKPGETADGSAYGATGRCASVRTAHRRPDLHLPTLEQLTARDGI